MDQTDLPADCSSLSNGIRIANVAAFSASKPAFIFRVADIGSNPVLDLTRLPTLCLISPPNALYVR